MDCFGYAGGPAELDECGICNGFNESQDCDDVCGGDSMYDECGTCELPDNGCEADCAGIYGGDSNYETYYYDGDGDGLGTQYVQWDFCTGDVYCSGDGEPGWCANDSDHDDEIFCPDNIWDCAGDCAGTAEPDGEGGCCDISELNDEGVCVGLSINEISIPDEFSIQNIYPNPFNTSANIVYTLPDYAHVKVTVYDLRGRTMAVLTNGYETAGYYTIQWNASAFASGVYFIEMRSDSFHEVRKVLHLK
jgi:hypothetical protein